MLQTVRVSRSNAWHSRPVFTFKYIFPPQIWLILRSRSAVDVCFQPKTNCISTDGPDLYFLLLSVTIKPIQASFALLWHNYVLPVRVRSR